MVAAIINNESVKVINEVFNNKCMHAKADTLNLNYIKTFMNLVKKAPGNTFAQTEAFSKDSIP